MKEEYSLVVVFKPGLTEKELPVDKVVTWVEEVGGKVVAKNHLGLKSLAYRIKTFNKGDFWELEIESARPLKIKDLSLYMNRETNVIRYLVLRK